eukprot:9125690-Pyramimonas_sp.AAC.1
MFAPDEGQKFKLDHRSPEGHCARLRVCVAGAMKAVVERGAGLLTLPRRVLRARRSRRCRCARGTASMGRSTDSHGARV